MRMYNLLRVSFLFIFMCNYGKAPKECCSIKTKNNPQKQYAILFDLMNVVIKENYTEFAKEVGCGDIASYMVTHWKNPGHRCLDMLDAMSKCDMQKPHIHISLKNRTIPRCLIELQEGKKNALQARDEIKQCIEHLDTQKHFSSTKEKALMANIMHVALDPELTMRMIEPIKPTVQLMQKLKKAGHAIYIFANAPDELYASVEKKYPDIIALCDGIIISSRIKTVKPDQAIFNHLLTTHNISPENCILIDDLNETVSAAEKLGMKAFVYDKNVGNKLKKYGVKW